MKREFPILRAIAKAIPVGNAIIEAVENKRAAKAIKQGLTLDNSVKVKLENGVPVIPHSWVSVIVQFAAVGTIIAAYFSDKISIDKLLELLKYFYI